MLPPVARRWHPERIFRVPETRMGPKVGRFDMRYDDVAYLTQSELPVFANESTRNTSEPKG
jgi:hypothetical protein